MGNTSREPPLTRYAPAAASFAQQQLARQQSDRSVISSILNPSLSVMVEYGGGNRDFRDRYNELRSEVMKRCPGSYVQGYGGRPNSFEVYVNGRSRVYSKLISGDMPSMKELAGTIQENFCGGGRDEMNTGRPFQMGGSGPPSYWGSTLRRTSNGPRQNPNNAVTEQLNELPKPRTLRKLQKGHGSLPFSRQ
jgi:selT/selW/selH-like putative selenoprotein